MTCDAAALHPLPGEAGYWLAYVASLAPRPAARFPYLCRSPDAMTAGGSFSSGRPGRRQAAKASVLTDCSAQVAALAEGEGDARAVERLLRMCSARPVSGGALVVGAGARGRALALCRAAADGRPYLGVPTLDDLEPRRLREAGAESCYVVAEHITVEQADRLVHEAHACGTEGRPLPLGFLHAASFELMTYLDAKQRLACAAIPQPRPDLLIDATESVEPVTGNGLEVIAYRNAGAADLRDRELSLLALTVHGMSDLLHLNLDYVCGKSRLATGRSSAALPACMTGGACFHKPGGRPVRAFEISARHVFVNSCGSLRFGQSDFGAEFDLWYTFLEGHALSYCGALRWKEGSGAEALLYQKLLRAGYTLGEACAMVNAALPALGAETDPVYALLGDPSYRPHPAAAHVLQQVSAGRSELCLHDGYAQARLDGHAFADAARGGALAVHGHGREQLLSAYVPAGPGVTVFVLGAGGRCGPVTVEVSDVSNEQAYYRDVARAISESLDPGLGFRGLYPEKARGAIRKDLESGLLNIAHLDHERFANPAAARRLLRSAAHLRKRVDELDCEIASWLTARLRSTTYRFAEQYAKACVLSAAGPGRGCPYCGRITHLRQVRQAARPHVTRTETICPACGGISDSPDDGLRCTIHLDPVVPVGSTATFTVSITNGGPLARSGYCVYGLRKSAALDIAHGEAIQRFSVDPTAAQEATFSFCAAAGTPAHQFDLQVVVIATGRLYLARRYVWLIAPHARAREPGAARGPAPRG